MSKEKSDKVYTLVDGGIMWLPPEQRDEAYIKKYGMTFEEWQKANPPPTDEEWKELFKRSKYKE